MTSVHGVVVHPATFRCGTCGHTWVDLITRDFLPDMPPGPGKEDTTQPCPIAACDGRSAFYL